MIRYIRLMPFVALSAILLLTASCGTSRKKVDTPVVETVNTAKLSGVDKKIVNEAMSWIGTPYKYGGTEKGRGTDCSGMVLKVYERVAGIKLPRNSRKQSEFCKRLKKKEVKPGDLVFFATGRDKKAVSHVGIMVDENRFIHASSKKGVILSEMTTPYYQRTFIMYGRVPARQR